MIEICFDASTGTRAVVELYTSDAVRTRGGLVAGGGCPHVVHGRSRMEVGGCCLDSIQPRVASICKPYKCMAA